MKVLLATGLYPPEIGGPATYTVLLEQQLPKHGHEVNVLAFRFSRKYPKILRHLHFFYRIVCVARQADVVFAQDVVSVGLPALLAAKILRKPFFVRVPGDYAWEQSVQRYGVKESIDDFQTRLYGWRIEFLRKIQVFVTCHATQVITPSDYFKNLVSRWGVRSEQIVTIYNGVDFSFDEVLIKKPAPLTLVSSGRLVPWKGFVVLIELMQKLPDWHLVILGEGPSRKYLEELIVKRSLGDRVHLKGSVSRSEVFAWCKVADAFVLNTHFESFSYQVIEAMYSGVPVLTTAVGSLPELITSGHEGILLAPDDVEQWLAAIESVRTDSLHWRERTRNAIEKAQLFSIERTTNAFVSCMEKYEKL